jgi:hypothetical protein
VTTIKGTKFAASKERHAMCSYMSTSAGVWSSQGDTALRPGYFLGASETLWPFS